MILKWYWISYEKKKTHLKSALSFMTSVTLPGLGIYESMNFHVHLPKSDWQGLSGFFFHFLLQQGYGSLRLSQSYLTDQFCAYWRGLKHCGNTSVSPSATGTRQDMFLQDCNPSAIGCNIWVFVWHLSASDRQEARSGKLMISFGLELYKTMKASRRCFWKWVF